MLEDAIVGLAGVDLRNRIQIEFVDSNFQLEDGIDGGGLFKEFMTLLAKQIVDPQYSFFVETEQ